MRRLLLAAVLLLIGGNVSAGWGFSSVTDTFDIDNVGDAAHIYRDFDDINKRTFFSDVYTLNVGGSFPLSIDGQHDGLRFQQLLLTDVNDLAGDGWWKWYTLSENFQAEIAMVDPGTYKLKLSGKALSSSSFYELHLTAVPLPAAVWMFGTAILGLFGYRKLRTRSQAGLQPA